MNISLTPQLEALVHAKVASGHYNSASEVVREALRLLDEHDQLRALRLTLLQEEIALGLDQLAAGQVTEHDAASLRQLFDEVKSKGRLQRKGPPPRR